MKKIIYISDDSYDGLFVKFNRRLLKNVKAFLFSGTEAALFIEGERPNFVFINLSEPVNGSRDMMCMLKELDSNIRLRVSVFVYYSLLSKIKDIFNKLFHRRSYNKKREVLVRR